MRYLKCVLFVIMTSMISIGASGETSKVSCSYVHATSIGAIPVDPGLVVGYIGAGAGADIAVQSAGTSLLPWLETTVKSQSIVSGDVFIVERTAESENVLSLLAGQIVNKVFTVTETTAWFLEFEDSVEIGNLNCKIN